MKLFLTLSAIVVAVSSAPQSLNVEDAEFVPGDVSRGSSGKGSSTSPDGIGIQVVRIPVPRFSILDLLFGDDETGTPQTRSNETRPEGDVFTRLFGGSFFPINTQDDSFFRFPSFFPRFPSFPPRFPTPEFPDFGLVPNITTLGDLPDGYTNSTHEVKVVNGSRVEVNQTISRTNDNGVVFTKVIFSVTPERNESSVPEIPQVTTEGKEIVQSSTAPEEDPRNNEVQTEPYEDFDVSSQ